MMRSLFLLLGLFLALSTPALACGGEAPDVRVVGFNEAGTKGLLRIEYAEDHAIDDELDDETAQEILLQMSIVDLASGKLEKSWVILRHGDRGDRQIRGRNWRAAERDILAMGFTIDPNLPSASFDGSTLRLSNGQEVRASSSASENYRLYTLQAATSELRFVVSWGMRSHPWYFAPNRFYASPDGRWLLVTWSILNQDYVSVIETASVLPPSCPNTSPR